MKFFGELFKDRAKTADAKYEGSLLRGVITNKLQSPKRDSSSENVNEEKEKNEKLLKRCEFLVHSAFISKEKRKEIQDGRGELLRLQSDSQDTKNQFQRIADLVSAAETERAATRESISGTYSTEKESGKDNNEDQAEILSKELFLVADGMGGVNEGWGKRASEFVLSFVKDYSSSVDWKKNITPEEATSQMRQLYDSLMKAFDEKHSKGELWGASTLTFCRVIENEGKESLVVLHVGDSPLYEYTSDKELVEIETQKKENTFLWNFLSEEERSKGLYELISKMIDLCKGDKLTHPTTKEKVFDFMMPEYDGIPDKYRNRAFIKRIRSLVSDGITYSDQSGFSYKPDIFVRPISSKYSKFFAFTDGVTNNLSKDDLQISVKEQEGKYGMNGKKVVEGIVKDAEEQLHQVEIIDEKEGISPRESLRKRDDKTGLVFDMATTLSSEELDVFELLADPNSIQTIEELIERLSLLDSKVISTAVRKEDGVLVKIKASDTLESIKTFDGFLSDKNGAEFQGFTDYLSLSGWVESSSDIFTTQLTGTYLNKKLKYFVSGYKIRATAARLFAQKYKEKRKEMQEDTVKLK